MYTFLDNMFKVLKMTANNEQQSWNGWIYFHVTDMEKIEKAKEDV